MTVSLDDVAAKVEAGEALSDEDVQALESGRDIISLGMLADSVRRKMHGPTITFVRVFDLTLEAGPKGPALRTESRPGPFGPGESPAEAGRHLYGNAETGRVASGFSRTNQKAVLLVSSYFPELLGVCDRIAVMSRGRLGPARPASEWTEHALLMEASGARVAS